MPRKKNKDKNKPESWFDLFTRISRSISHFTGTPWAFLLAALTIIVWLTLGPYYQYSDTWQLIINTGTTIITFLMVFLIQNAQNRDSKAIELKLDELLEKTPGTDSNNYIHIEELTEEEIELLSKRFDFLKPKDRKTKE